MITDTVTQLLNGTPVDSTLLQTAIATALSRYSQDAPLELMAVCTVDNAGVVGLPANWVQGVSDVVLIEQIYTAVNSGGGVGTMTAAYNGTVLGDFSTLNIEGVGVDASLQGGVFNVQAPPPTFSISGFAVAPALLEYGNVSQSVTLLWTYGGLAPTSQTLNGVVLDPALRTYVVAGGLASPVTFNLAATAGSKIASRTVSITYASRVYSGNSTDSALADMASLANVLKPNAGGTYSFAAGVGVYKYIAIPSDYAAINPDTGFIDASTGFPVSFELPYVITLTNAYGYVQDYNVYRSYNKLNGAINIRI